jgi:hypothetical protein
MQTFSVARRTALISCWMIACVARTSPQTDSSEAPPVFSERDAPIDGGCPSVVDMPQTLFQGRIELQLPVGVSTLTEEAPGRLAVRDRTAPCAGGRTVTSIMVIEMPNDGATLPIGFVRDQLLDVLGLPGGLQITTREEDDATRRMTSMIRVPAEPETGRQQPAGILLALRGGGGRLYVLMFESSAEQFEGLLPSFDASLDSFRIVDGG